MRTFALLSVSRVLRLRKTRRKFPGFPAVKVDLRYARRQLRVPVGRVRQLNQGTAKRVRIGKIPNPEVGDLTNATA
jgi:hypothetical protein